MCVLVNIKYEINFLLPVLIRNRACISIRAIASTSNSTRKCITTRRFVLGRVTRAHNSIQRAPLI